jgi:hypothetical protein
VTPPISNRERIGAWADFVYLRRGGVTHIKPFSEQAAYPAVLCGRTPDLFEAWLGTGNQTERDKARRMPLCVPCMKLSRGRTR